MSGSRPTWGGADGRHRGLRRRDARESLAGLGTVASRGGGHVLHVPLRGHRPVAPYGTHTLKDLTPISPPYPTPTWSKCPEGGKPGAQLQIPGGDVFSPKFGLL